jgi:hypothetical protein
MKRSPMMKTALAVAMVLVAVTANAQDAAPVPAVDPAATKALEGMSTYLRSLKTYSVEAASATDEVLEDGQVSTNTAKTVIVVQMPSKLFAETSSDRQSRSYVYDGKTFTLYARRVGYYATVPAPATLRALADALSDKYGIELPLTDLFLWGAPGWGTGEITAAVDLGPAEVAGTTCQHYAFRQPGVDWQIWIQKGDFPLPRRLAIATTDDDAKPRHMVTYTWNLAPSVNDEAFTFTAPKGANRIVLATVSQ